MMNQQELEQFRKVLESTLVTDKINDGKKEEILPLLSNIITFLTVTKRYNELENHLAKHNSSLNQYFFDKYSFRKAYLNNGYLYHITGYKNVESVLENGILTLNQKYNQNMFIDCRKVNRCWHEIIKRNDKRTQSKALIVIPGYSKLYKQRFNSVYLTTNLSFCWQYYGKGSELYQHYIRKLGRYLGVETDKLKKEELQEVFRKKLQENYNIFEDEIAILMEFYDTYYDLTYLNKEIEDKAIIMIPYQNAKSKNKSFIYNYKRTIKNPVFFEKNIFKMTDIEHKGSIKKEGLIAVTMESFDKNKVKLKVREKDLNL